jgi:hypothetical protein
MTATLTRLSATVLFLVTASLATAQFQSAASLEAQARTESTFAARAQMLNERIARGWPVASVQALLGEPEHIQRSTDGRDQIEVWGYHGFDVRIQFRNGFVDTWFVRFAQ